MLFALLEQIILLAAKVMVEWIYYICSYIYVQIYTICTCIEISVVVIHVILEWKFILRFVFV